MKKRIAAILAVALFSCAVMALVDGVLKPGYAIKSAIKLVMFLGLPLLLSLFDRELSLKPLLRFQKKGFLTALALGIGLFALVLAALFVGGLIFNRLNEKQETVYTSWLTHMFANFAINLIGFTLMG